nr:unnamed protein product [Digitaria exilis]
MHGKVVPSRTTGGGGSSVPWWLATQGEAAPPPASGGGGPPLLWWLATQGEAAPPPATGGGGSSLPRWLATQGETTPPLSTGGGGQPLPQWLATQDEAAPPPASRGGGQPLPHWLAKQGEAAPPPTTGGGGQPLPRWLAIQGEASPLPATVGGGPPLPRWLAAQGEATLPSATRGGGPPLPRWLAKALQVNRNINLGMVADTESSGSLPGSSNAAAAMPVHGSLDQRSQEKAPKKTHKAEREKLKRDQLNDLFLELGSMLGTNQESSAFTDLDRQNTGKATILGDATRELRDLVTQVESLRKEQSALLSERQYVSSDKNELQEENSTLKAHISELVNELYARMGNSNLSVSCLGMSYQTANATSSTHPIPHQMWSNTPNLSSVSMAHQMNTLSPQQSQHHSANDVEVYSLRPQELQLFPGPLPSPEGECSRVRSAPDTSSSLTDSLPGQLRLSLTQSSQEESSSCVLVSRKERRNG